jgi:hypothetical protein
MYALEICSHEFLRNGVREDVINEEDLAKLREDVEALLNKVINSNIGETLKKVLIEELKNIHRAIIFYQIDGIEGLRQALKSSAGAIHFYREQIVDELQDSREKQTISEFFELLQRIDIIIGLSKAANEGINFLASLLPNNLLGSGSP